MRGCPKYRALPKAAINFSGKFVLRVSPEVHEAAAIAAAASGESLNQWVADAIKEAAHA